MAGDLYDDEISLYEIWNVLQRQRRVVAAVFVLSLVLAAGYTLWRTPLYTMDAVVEIGQIPSADGSQVVPIDPADGLVSQLNEVIIPQIKRTPVFRGTLAGSAQVLNAEARLVRLSTVIPAEAAARAEWFLDEVIAALQADHGSIWTQQNARLQQRIAALRDQAGQAVNRPQIGGSEAQSRMASDGALWVRHLMDREAKEALIELNTTLTQLESARLASSPTQLVRAPALADTAEGQPATTVMMLAAVLGLMLGVFAAFGREFLANARAER